MNPLISLIQDEEGDWNLAKALVADETGEEEAETPSGDGGAIGQIGQIGIDVLLGAFSIQQATIEIARADQDPAAPYRLHDINLEAHASFDDEQLNAALDRFVVGIAAAPTPALSIEAAAAVHGPLDMLDGWCRLCMIF